MTALVGTTVGNPTVRLYSLRRYYDPQAGQFISVDPAVDQTEAPYAYVNGDPVDGVDPLGLGIIGSLEGAWNTVNPWSTSNVFYGIASSGGTGATILGLNPFLPAAADFVGAANACSSGAEAEGILAGIGWTLFGAIDPEADEAEVAAEEADLALSSSESWGNQATLEDHFLRHGADFGASSSEEYASQASSFLQRGLRGGAEVKVDSQGVIRVYDPKTDTFGAYNPDGTTRTFYRPDPAAHGYPTNQAYWKAQPGNAP